jgi:hypothetical protein
LSRTLNCPGREFENFSQAIPGFEGKTQIPFISFFCIFPDMSGALSVRYLVARNYSKTICFKDCADSNHKVHKKAEVKGARKRSKKSYQKK